MSKTYSSEYLLGTSMNTNCLTHSHPSHTKTKQVRKTPKMDRPEKKKEKTFPALNSSSNKEK